jgi:hypothetical protein
MGIPFVLYVEWSDCFGSVIIERDMIKTVMMQSVNFRDDQNDIEPCVMIPIMDFRIY